MNSALDYFIINEISKKVSALNEIVSSDVFKEQFTTFKRVANISKDIDLESDLAIDTTLFKEDADDFEKFSAKELAEFLQGYIDAEEDETKKQKLQSIVRILEGIAAGRTYPFPYSYPHPDSYPKPQKKGDDTMGKEGQEELKQLKAELEKVKQENAKVKQENEELYSLLKDNLTELKATLDKYNLVPKEKESDKKE